MLVTLGMLCERSQVGGPRILQARRKKSRCRVGNIELRLPPPLAITLPVTAETSRQFSLGSDSTVEVTRQESKHLIRRHAV